MARYINGIKLYRTPKVKYSKDNIYNPSSKSHPHVILGEKNIDGKKKLASVSVTHAKNVPDKVTLKTSKGIAEQYFVSSGYYLRNESDYVERHQNWNYKISPTDKKKFLNVLRNGKHYS